MPANLYSLAPAKFNSLVVPIKSLTISPGLISEMDQHSGNLYPTLVRVSGAEPKIIITMPFAPAHAALGTGVTKLTIFEAWLAKFADFTRDAGATHAKFALTGGSVAAAMITGLSADINGDLLATVEITPIADTSFTNPLALTTGTLPTLAGQPLLFTLGPATINGTLAPGLISAGTDFAQILIPQRTDGSKYTMAAARVGATPRCFAEHSDPITLLATLTLDGVSASTNFIQYFRGYDATTGVVSNAAGSACSLTIAAGRAHPLEITGTQGALAKMGMEFLPTSATATHPIAISLTSTVPTVS